MYGAWRYCLCTLQRKRGLTPFEKLLGDQVFAATVVVTGKICIKVEKSGQETTIAKINQILNSSIDVKTNFHRHITHQSVDSPDPLY